MPAAFVQTFGAAIRLEGEHLVVMGPRSKGSARERLLTMPLCDVDSMALAHGVQISSQAVVALMRRGISVQFFDGMHRVAGGFWPPPLRGAACRLAQYRRSTDPSFSAALARAVVLAKIANQKRVLQRLNANRPSGLEGEIARMGDFETLAKSQADVAVLRGCEGASTAHYFALWARFLPEDFPFERRSSRPPKNAVNACISFGSAIVYGELTHLLVRHQIDPGIGFLHATEDGRCSAALDLMEPFRPAVVEALAMRLLAHRMLQARHFEGRDGGVFLNREGRDIYLRQYETRASRSFWSEQVQERLTLRKAMEADVLKLKKTILEGGEFHPFLLN